MVVGVAISHDDLPDLQREIEGVVRVDSVPIAGAKLAGIELGLRISIAVARLLRPRLPAIVVRDLQRVLIHLINVKLWATVAAHAVAVAIIITILPWQRSWHGHQEEIDVASAASPIQIHLGYQSLAVEFEHLEVLAFGIIRGVFLHEVVLVIDAVRDCSLVCDVRAGQVVGVPAAILPDLKGIRRGSGPRLECGNRTMPSWMSPAALGSRAVGCCCYLALCLKHRRFFMTLALARSIFTEITSSSQEQNRQGANGLHANSAPAHDRNTK
mmetsp:Transcript_6060/g.11050  ORF Transcript_6060/g.11050 Transcript_6060/m.11050 type:complete len:270 (+) Transcript_6060:470-1279(+)